MDISVVGLGKLGSPLAALAASKGHRVIGVDVSERIVQDLNAGRAPVAETGLAGLIAETDGRLTATTDIAAAVSASDVTFIVVPTPSEGDGRFSLRFVLSAIEAIGGALRTKDGYHLVVVTSTVLPGATTDEIVPALEVASGRRVGVDVGLCYNPEFIALGSVIADMLLPDMILVGESDRRAGDLLEEFQRSIVENDPPFARTGFVNAELTKIAINTYVTTKISYANMIAAVCDEIAGADADVVTGALGLDSRIGKKYLRAGTAFGGPCFPRDNLAFVAFARDLGVQPFIAEATHALNVAQTQRLVSLVTRYRPNGGTVAVLGLSYKPATTVVEESAGMALAEALVAADVPVVVYDPEALETARATLGEAVHYASSLREAIERADILVVTTLWDEFVRLSAADFVDAPARRIVVDCWRALDADALGESVDLVAVGRGAALADPA
jgi:UDPglucose 6-dehydrogenase